MHRVDGFREGRIGLGRDGVIRNRAAELWSERGPDNWCPSTGSGRIWLGLAGHLDGLRVARLLTIREINNVIG